MYYNKIPNILYLRYNKNPYDGTYVLIKNIFARIKLVDDIIPNATLFNDYFVKDGERPDTVSFDVYGDSDYDWIVILINNIRNLYSDWPMTSRAFDEYVSQKYTDISAPHHYETIEQYYNGKKILDGGLEVGEAFQFVKPNGDVVPKTEARAPVSNYAYELDLNEKKREIFLLKPSYLEPFLDNFRKTNLYQKSKDYISSTLKKTGV